MQEILKTPKIIYPHIKKVLVIGMMVGLITLLTLSPSNGVSATGNGSPAECDNPIDKADGNDNLLTYTSPSGNVIIGICIHSGSNMFGGTQHSGLLSDGTYESGCYVVSGVNTQTVTVTRVGSESPSCQGLSHIDIFYSPNSTPTPSPSPSSNPSSSPAPTPTPTPTPELTSSTPTPSPIPSSSPSPTPIPTSTPTPSPSPSSTATSTTSTTSNTTNSGTNGAVAGASATASNESSTPTPSGAVLGASAELPATGTETIWPLLGIFSFLLGAGLIVLGLI